MLVGGLPVCFAVVLAVWGLDITGGDDHLPMWMKPGCSALMLIVACWIFTGYFKFDEKVREMEKSVGAQNANDMLNLLAACTEVGENYYISDEAVINFDSFQAYHRSEIHEVRTAVSKDNSRYSVAIIHGSDVTDNMYFSNAANRDQVYNMLKK